MSAQKTKHLPAEVVLARKGCLFLPSLAGIRHFQPRFLTKSELWHAQTSADHSPRQAELFIPLLALRYRLDKTQIQRLGRRHLGVVDDLLDVLHLSESQGAARWHHPSHKSGPSHG